MHVLIDGRSGSGKTTLAAVLSRLMGFEVVHLDDFYPGWGGLAAAEKMVAEQVLHPIAPRFRRWDWERNEPGQWVHLQPGQPRIIEGVGAVTAASINAAKKLGPVVSIRLHLDAELRKQRALTRDPEFARWWDFWAAQEEARGNLVPVDFELGTYNEGL